jgi:uncharacterized phiE125 gp8 family phage protein
MKQGYFQLSNTKIVSRSDTAILTLAEAKSHLRVTFEDEDGLISGLISAATDYIEAVIECPVTEAAMTLNFDTDSSEPFDRVYIRVRNATSVTEVSFDGQAADTGTYALNSLQSLPFVQLNTSVKASQINVLFTAGFTEVPASIRQAALLIIGHWYKNTDAVTNGTNDQPYVLPLAVDSLLSRFKVEAIA